MRTLFFVLTAFIASVWGSPAVHTMRVHESRSSVPDGFVKGAPAPVDKMLKLRIALKQSDRAGLEQALLAVSTPGNPEYGHHLTKEEAEKFVAPSPESVKLVNSWLSANGITANTPSLTGGWLQFSIPVGKANSLLQTEFTVFSHSETGKELTRTLAYSIPAALQDHVELVHPTITFDIPFVQGPLVSFPNPPTGSARPSLESRAVPSSCNTVTTPNCLLALYAIPTNFTSTSMNTLAVTGFFNQFAIQSDLTTFLRSERPDLPITTGYSVQLLEGGADPQTDPGGNQANLDIQYTVGLASGVPTTFMSVGRATEDTLIDSFIFFIDFLLAQPDVAPLVLTISYGQNENTMSSQLANVLCTFCAQLGARGTSILFASGDGGVGGAGSLSGGPGPVNCTTKFVPTFPSSCPWVTSVGATTGTTETAASFSSGGFSNIFGRPSYQDSAVTSYLNALGSTNSGKFNASGRAFPDVSAQGTNFQFVSNNQTGVVSGTSCASNTFASVVSLLNSQLLYEGEAPLGFLNPFLYSAAGATALNDITTGSNPGCGTNGFPAKVGWDPVTGLGTPNFTNLFDVLLPYIDVGALPMKFL